MPRERSPWVSVELHEEGTIRDQDFNRYNLHLNVNRKFLKSWEMGGSLYFTYSKQNAGSYRDASLQPIVFLKWHIHTMKRAIWHIMCSVMMEQANPLLESTADGEHRETKRYRILGNVYLQYKPIKGLDAQEPVCASVPL